MPFGRADRIGKNLSPRVKQEVWSSWKITPTTGSEFTAFARLCLCTDKQRVGCRPVPPRKTDSPQIRSSQNRRGGPTQSHSRNNRSAWSDQNGYRDFARCYPCVAQGGRQIFDQVPRRDVSCLCPTCDLADRTVTGERSTSS